MKVSQAMHRTASWVEPTLPISEIAKIMKEQDIGAVPVGENDRLIGMVTDRDIALRALANGHDVSKMTARDVMTTGISYCRSEDTLDDAVHLMEQKKIRRLPVIDTNKRMVGILSVGDVSHSASSRLTDELMKAVSDHHT